MQLNIISGPTASGKTDLTIRLAEHFHSEILSADSRQFYKKMDIGTAKPSAAELAQVPHHFISFLEPEEEYNIGRYEQGALSLLEELFKKQEHVFMTGGSGLYIKAVCEGMDELPESEESLRAELTSLYKESGIKVLQERLQIADPEYYEEADINNPHRLIRALEVITITGEKYSTLRKHKPKERPFTIKHFSLLVERDDLYTRINTRVDKMMKSGLLDEVKSLLPYRNCNALQTVGYREFFDFLDDKYSLGEAIELVKQNTRHYAKRQMTWLRKQPNIDWITSSEFDEIIQKIQD